MRRILMLVPVLFGVTFIVFALMYITPSDPAQMMLGPNASPAAYKQMKADMGLDNLSLSSTCVFFSVTSIPSSAIKAFFSETWPILYLE
jgi:ABC-type dipeptide/oligopeptide/nickel transport system permease component